MKRTRCWLGGFLELILTVAPLRPCIWLPTLSEEADHRPFEKTGNEQQEVLHMDADDLVAFRNTRRIHRSAWGSKDPVHQRRAQVSHLENSLARRAEQQLPPGEAA